MDSNSTLSQIRNLMGQYQQYTPTNVADITRQFMGNVGNMAPQYNELAAQQAKTYAMPGQLMKQYSQESPDTGMGASSRLSDIMSQIGQQQGITGSMSNAIDAAKGRVGDYAQTAYDQYLAAQNQLMNQINPMTQLYGTQKGAEAQIQAANISVGPQMQRLGYLQQIRDLLKNYGETTNSNMKPMTGNSVVDAPNTAWNNVYGNQGNSNDLMKQIMAILSSMQ